MTHKTDIQWATDSANVYRYEKGGWHCVKVSEGCRNCYAERLNMRFGYGGANGRPYRVDSRQHLGNVTLNEKMLNGWRTSKQPRRIFVNSMTDTFLETIPDEMIFRLFSAMAESPRQMFYVLTKRAERMATVIEDWLDLCGYEAVPNNIMCGVSIESQKVVEDRLYWLSRVPGLRFISAEPLLAPTSLHAHLADIHQVILGGESGTGARAMHPGYAGIIHQETQYHHVPFFFKQWGAWWPLRELVEYHGLPDNALAYAGFGFVNVEGKFLRRAEAFGGRYAAAQREPITHEGRYEDNFYEDFTLMVKPTKEQKPAQATLNGVVYNEYSPLHRAMEEALPKVPATSRQIRR